MKIIGTGETLIDEKNKKITYNQYIVLITEAEADMITGVAGLTHITGRYRPGVEVNVTDIYEKVKEINKSAAKIEEAVLAVKSHADDIANAIPLTQEKS